MIFLILCLVGGSDCAVRSELGSMEQCRNAIRDITGQALMGFPWILTINGQPAAAYCLEVALVAPQPKLRGRR